MGLDQEDSLSSSSVAAALSLSLSLSLSGLLQPGQLPRSMAK
jgi:hypothetical protein